MNVRLLLLLVAIALACPQTRVHAARRSGGNNSMMRQYQQMQLKLYQARVQQFQAAQQAKDAKRQHRQQMSREAADRERERKEVAAHKTVNGGMKQIGSGHDESGAAKDSKPKSDEIAGAPATHKPIPKTDEGAVPSPKK